MAARTADDLPDEELDPVEAADEAVDDDGFDLTETDLGDDPDLELDDEAQLDDDDDAALDDDVDVDVDEGALESDVETDDADEPDPLLLPSFDDEEDEEIVRVVEEDDDDFDADGLREGEFVCRSCYMAKRESALADPKRMLCRDCA